MPEAFGRGMNARGPVRTFHSKLAAVGKGQKHDADTKDVVVADRKGQGRWKDCEEQARDSRRRHTEETEARERRA